MEGVFPDFNEAFLHVIYFDLLNIIANYNKLSTCCFSFSPGSSLL